MPDTSYLLSAIVVMVVVNFLTRVAAFLFFPSGKTPSVIRFVEIYFPPVILTILIFYSLKDTDFQHAPYGLHEWIGVTLTFVLHLVFKNYLVSIIGGTIGYMAMVQGWLG